MQSLRIRIPIKRITFLGDFFLLFMSLKLLHGTACWPTEDSVNQSMLILCSWRERKAGIFATAPCSPQSPLLLSFHSIFDHLSSTFFSANYFEWF